MSTSECAGTERLDTCIDLNISSRRGARYRCTKHRVTEEKKRGKGRKRGKGGPRVGDEWYSYFRSGLF